MNSLLQPEGSFTKEKPAATPDSGPIRKKLVDSTTNAFQVITWGEVPREQWWHCEIGGLVLDEGQVGHD